MVADPRLRRRCDTGVEKLTCEAARRSVPEAGLGARATWTYVPEAGERGRLLGAPNVAAWYLDGTQEHLDDLDLLSGSRSRACRLRAETPRAGGASPPAAARVGPGVLRGRPAAHTDHGHHGVPGGGPLSGPVNGQEVDLMILSATFTAPFNITGQPGFSIPAGLVEGMPVGMQVVARRHEDDLLRRGRRAHGSGPPLAKLAPGYE